MKSILLVMMIIVLVAAIGCSSAISDGDKTSDSTHSFLVYNSQIIDQIGEDIVPEKKAYLVIKYEVENLQPQNDSGRRWTDQIVIEAKEKHYEPTFIEAFDDQLSTTSLLVGETKVGYMVFTVPDNVYSFKLIFTFPTSENEVTYELSPVDKRIDVNADYVLTRLQQIEKTKGIPLIGGLLNSFTSSPIQYLGVILVPEEEISPLLEQTEGLDEAAKEKVIEDYLLAHGYCRLE